MTENNYLTCYVTKDLLSRGWDLSQKTEKKEIQAETSFAHHQDLSIATVEKKQKNRTKI